MTGKATGTLGIQCKVLWFLFHLVFQVSGGAREGTPFSLKIALVEIDLKGSSWVCHMKEAWEQQERAEPSLLRWGRSQPTPLTFSLINKWVAKKETHQHEEKSRPRRTETWTLRDKPFRKQEFEMECFLKRPLIAKTQRSLRDCPVYNGECHKNYNQRTVEEPCDWWSRHAG